MNEARKIRDTWRGKPTIEGAGVRLKRAFAEPTLFDPFLLMDDFHSNDPEDYIQGFPWHPHRGIETITYVLQGKVEHGDSLGNEGVISSGDVQWMTAGSGIIHQEMPKGDAKGRMGGFQLWANLPQAQKMIEPRYRDITSRQIPEVTLAGGAKVRVICGKVGDCEGPVTGIVIAPEYLDVTLPAGAKFHHPTHRGHTVFAYVFEGRGYFDGQNPVPVGNGDVCLFTDGDYVAATTGNEPVRFLLISGAPLGEPVAWHGPIVMNTDEELRHAFEEYRNGTFIKHGKPR